MGLFQAVLKFFEKEAEMSACTPTVSLHDGGRLKCNVMGSFSLKISPVLHYRIEVPALQSAAVFLVLCTAVSFITELLPVRLKPQCAPRKLLHFIVSNRFSLTYTTPALTTSSSAQRR